MRSFRLIPLAAVVAVPLWLTGCATETSQALNATQTQSASCRTGVLSHKNSDCRQHV